VKINGWVATPLSAFEREEEGKLISGGENINPQDLQKILRGSQLKMLEGGVRF